MKKLLILVWICSVYELQAQTITFDYALKAYVPPEINCVRQGASISYQLININTFANKVLISGNFFSLNTDIPPAISTVFSIKATSADDKLKNTDEQVGKMETVKNEAVAKKSAEVQSLTTLVEYCEDYYEEAQKIKRVLTVPQIMAGTMADGGIYNEQMMATALSTKGLSATSIATMKAGLAAFIAAYEKAYDQYEVASKAARDAKNEVAEAQIISAQEQVRNDYQALRQQYEDALMSIDDLFSKALNPVNYTFISENPFYVEDDIDGIELQIQVGNSKGDFSKINPYKKILKVEGGLKIDYSVGPVFKFIADDSYYFDDKSQLRKRGNNNALTPGIASMMHLYKRTCATLALGGMFGLNADFKEITDINLGFLAGASLMLGRSQKAILSTGISYSKVSRLIEGQYTIGTAYSGTKIDDVTERVLKPSWFISFSYSITKRTIVKP